MTSVHFLLLACFILSSFNRAATIRCVQCKGPCVNDTKSRPVVSCATKVTLCLTFWSTRGNVWQACNSDIPFGVDENNCKFSWSERFGSPPPGFEKDNEGCLNTCDEDECNREGCFLCHNLAITVSNSCTKTMTDSKTVVIFSLLLIIVRGQF